MEHKRKLPLWARIVLMALVLLLYPALNMLIDPFGVFGDPVFDWYGYDEYNNPRAAKIAWLEEHHGAFDSYIIGSSCAAAINPLELNEYMDARFYNLFSYGSDMHNYRANATYLLEHYEVKNLVLNLNLTEVSEYDIRKDDIHYRPGLRGEPAAVLPALRPVRAQICRGQGAVPAQGHLAAPGV